MAGSSTSKLSRRSAVGMGSRSHVLGGMLVMTSRTKSAVTGSKVQKGIPRNEGLSGMDVLPEEERLFLMV